MAPQTLIDQASAAGMPAPVWFVQFFKALGFTLHAVPMNLWYAGLLVALLLRVVGNEHARRFAARLLRQMPVIVAVGVNLGIVPLLFLQLAYYKVFYPATILMAWFWLAIIGLLIPAYYGVYAYAWGIRGGDGPFTQLRRFARRLVANGGRLDRGPVLPVHRLSVRQWAESDGPRGPLARALDWPIASRGRHWERR